MQGFAVFGSFLGRETVDEGLDLIDGHEAALGKRFGELAEYNFHNLPLEIMQSDCSPFYWGASSWWRGRGLWGSKSLQIAKGCP